MSALRCKPGDLAVVVGPGVLTPGLLGRFVIVERQGVTGEIIDTSSDLGRRVRFLACDAEGAWLCFSATDGAMLPIQTETQVFGVGVRMIADSILRPIRHGEGEDETLTWAGKPVGDLA